MQKTRIEKRATEHILVSLFSFLARSRKRSLQLNTTKMQQKGKETKM